MRAVIRIMEFWLAYGVDGFRLDAIPYLVEREGTSNENLRETHAIIKPIRRVITEKYADRMLLAEANQWPEDVRDYFGDGDECHMAYHFPLMPRMYMAIAQEDRHPIVEIMEQTPDIPDNCQWAIFLRNHDELTLEMVTSRERDYMYQMYAADPRARLNLGIRRRLAPLLENDPERIKLMNSLLLSMPGAPIIYYGDEIGMGDNFFLGDRNGVRTPMQWSPDRNAGFSRADPQQLFLPPIMDPIYGYEAVNVEAQTRDRSSLLNWMKRMLQVRKSSQAFGRGTLKFIRPGNRKVLVYLRQYGDDTILCVVNLSRSAQPVEINLAGSQGHRADRAARQHPLSADRRAAVSPDSARLRLLLVPPEPRGPGAAVARRAHGAGGPAGAGAGGGLEQLLPRARRHLAPEPGDAPARAARKPRHSAFRRGAALVCRQGRTDRQRQADRLRRARKLARSLARHDFHDREPRPRPTTTSSRSPLPSRTARSRAGRNCNPPPSRACASRPPSACSRTRAWMRTSVAWWWMRSAPHASWPPTSGHIRCYRTPACSRSCAAIRARS